MLGLTLTRKNGLRNWLMENF